MSCIRRITERSMSSQLCVFSRTPTRPPNVNLMCFRQKCGKGSSCQQFVSQSAGVSSLQDAKQKRISSLFVLWRYRNDVTIVVNPLTTQNRTTAVCVEALGAVIISVLVELLLMERSQQTAFAGNWKQRIWPSLTLNSVFKLEGNTRLLRFSRHDLTSGSRLCLHESATTFTCNKRCDCSYVAAVNDSFNPKFYNQGFVLMTVLWWQEQQRFNKSKNRQICLSKAQKP